MSLLPHLKIATPASVFRAKVAAKGHKNLISNLGRRESTSRSSIKVRKLSAAEVQGIKDDCEAAVGPTIKLLQAWRRRSNQHPGVTVWD